MALEAMADAGSPRCLFPSGILPLVGLDDMQAAPYFFPFDTPAYQKAMGQAFMSGKTSSCGLTAEVGWRYAGVTAPILYESYADRVSRAKYVIVADIEVAKNDDAWMSGIPWVEGTPLPDVGDMPIIGCKGCGDSWARNVSNLEHAYTILCYDPAGRGIHHSIDGGQPGVAFRTRALVEVWTGQDAQGRRTGELWAAKVNDDGTVPLAADGRPLTGRRFVGFASVPRLARGEPEGPCLSGQGGALDRLVSPGGQRVVKVVGAAAALGLLAFLAKRYAERSRR